MSDARFGWYRGNPDVSDEVILKLQDDKIKKLTEENKNLKNQVDNLKECISKYKEHDKRQKQIFFEGTLHEAVKFLQEALKKKDDNRRVILGEIEQMINLNNTCRKKIQSLINFLSCFRRKGEVLLEKLQMMLENDSNNS